MDENGLRISFVNPVKLFEVFHIFKMSAKSNRHSFSDSTIHDGFTSFNFVGLIWIRTGDDYVAWVVHHNSVESRLVALIVDFDVDRMLPMNVSIMIECGSNLRTNHFG